MILMVKKQELIYQNQNQTLLTLQDVTKVHEVSRLQGQNMVIQMFYAMSHTDMIAPLRTVVQIADGLPSTPETDEGIKAISNTISMLLYTVYSNLD